MLLFRLYITSFLLITISLRLAAYGQNPVAPPVFPSETGTIADTLLVDSLLVHAWETSTELPDTAFLYANRALELAEKIAYESGQGDALHIIGTTYWYRANYEKAVGFLFRAMSLRERINDKLGLGRSYNNIGLIYFDQENYEEAIAYFEKSLAIRRILRDSSGLIYSFNNIADVFRMQNRFEGASNIYKQGLYIAQASGNGRGESFVYYNIGQLFEQWNQPDSAKVYYERALEIAQRIDYKIHEIKILNAYADLLLKHDSRRIEEVQQMAALSLDLSAAIRAKEQQKESARILAAAAAMQGNYSIAYDYQQLYQNLYEEYLNESTQRTVLEIEANYHTTQRERDLLEKEREVSRLNLLFLATLFALLLVTSISIILRFRTERRNRQLLEKKNAEIAAQNQALMLSNDTLEQFAYVASHDLKEPLRNIGSFSTLLERRYRDKLGDAGKDYIRFISNSVRQMYELLEDILAYSKLENVQSSEAELVDMTVILQKVKLNLETVLLEKNAKLSYGPLPSVKTHRTQMQQLLQNLVSNGLKFNESEQPEVKVSAKVVGQSVHFVVQDNGIGIDPEYREKIFQVFQRLHKGEYPGTGIGLAICARIVNNWGGQIWVDENPEGNGTAFHFTLPFGAPAKPNNPNISADARHPASFPAP